MEMSIKKTCFKCGLSIDLQKDLYCLLATYEGETLIGDDYFHMNCWSQYFEGQTRKKAEVIVKSMQERMMPIAKQMTEKLKGIMKNLNDGENDRVGGTPNITI